MFAIKQKYTTEVKDKTTGEPASISMYGYVGRRGIQGFDTYTDAVSYLHNKGVTEDQFRDDYKIVSDKYLEKEFGARYLDRLAA